MQRAVLARMNMLVTLHLRRRSRLDANQEMRLLACWRQRAVPVVDERVEIHIKTNTFLQRLVHDLSVIRLDWLRHRQDTATWLSHEAPSIRVRDLLCIAFPRRARFLC